jgi:hypothetical protein
VGGITKLAIRAVALAVAVVVTVEPSAAVFDLPMAGKKLSAASEPRKKSPKFVLRGAPDVEGFLPSPATGATRVIVTEVFCTPASAGEFCVETASSGEIDLDPTLWTPLGDPPGSRGYRYRDRDGTRGGIRGALIANDKLLIKARGDDWPLAPTGIGTGVQVRVLRDELEFCADFGGVEKRNEPGFLRYIRADAPAFCGAACGNGLIENGEGCDPPDGAQCDAQCRLTCAADPGSILVACSSSGDGTLAFAGDGDDFLLAWADLAREGDRIRATRIDAGGTIGDVPALELSDGATHSTTPLAVIDDAGFYVLWTTGGSAFAAGRRIPLEGIDFGAIETRGANGPPSPGQCGSFGGPPLGLGANLGGATPFVSAAEHVYCGGPLFTYLTGVPGAGFLLEPPYSIDAPPAAFARSHDETVAVWVRGDVDPLAFTLQANWMDVSSFTPAFQLTTLPTATAQPAVAAVGETFLAVWTTGAAVRGMRFVHPGTALDAAGGFAIANAAGDASLPQVASEAHRFVVAWRDRAAGVDRVRAVHVEPGGSVVEPAPVEVAQAPMIADLGLAAGTASTWIAFTTVEPGGAHAVRIAPVP